MSTRTRASVIVIGASTAHETVRVPSDHADHVTVFERDRRMGSAARRRLAVGRIR